ncbi:glomulin, FKBP associated protein b [Pygocentrus nattereri]|uniref:Glomulin, FKBP associated protein b n=1 Tax=Pygocentrus nattereri TaxID=42514 RepID=A0AAR2JDA7_PYGNA|nr:glomulin, FKBP associated protein b [Pygocentrus nattereri]
MAANELDDVIQRWRRTKEKDLKPEDHELFLSIAGTCIAQSDIAQLLDFIKEEKNQNIVKAMGCGLLGPLIKEVVEKKRDPVNCEAIITHLVQICRANDLLDVLLREMEDAGPDATADAIILLMQHIHLVLSRLGDSKALSLGRALDALQKQISKLPVPYSRKQEQEDKYGLCRCCTALLTFVQPFVQEVKSQETKSPVTTSNDEELRTVLLKFCMQSLREPLLEAQLDREADTSQNSALWNFATEIMAILSAIQEPLPKLLFYYPLRGKEDMGVRKQDNSHTTESRACLAYLLFVQLIAMEVFPAVFSPIFVLQCNMEYISILLSRKDESWILKGLDLYVKTLERVLDNSLPVQLLELRTFYSVPQILVKIMIECPIQHLRVKALIVFQLFIEKLNGEAKHKFFRCTMKTCQHAGVESIILKNIKNQAEHSSKSEQRDGWFEGTLLITLLRDTVNLPQGPETDLLHGMDRVMESLNLLRYLLIKERSKATAIWTDLCNIAETYIKILRMCLSMSKSYYGTELKKLHEEKRIKAKEFKEMSKKKPIQHMIVKNESLDGMPPEAQDKVLQCALVTYDLMESLVVRIEEIIEERV